MRPLILVSNDDGYRAEGILALAEALSRFAEVVTVAPRDEQSAKSHSFSLHRAIMVREVRERVFVADGTPADCVYIGLHGEILERRPDLVASGINHGGNLAQDVHYSGTVAAAREGALRGVPGIAFSMLPGGTLVEAAKVASEIAERFLESERPEGDAPLLNVNFPGGSIAGVRAAKLGYRQYDEGVDLRNDPRGRRYVWIGGPGGVSHPPIEGSDTEAVDAGYASITPLRLEHTYPEHFGLAAFAAGPNSNDEKQ